MVAKAVKDRNKIALAALELANDKNFNKLPNDKRIELIEDALRIGSDAADNVISECGTSDPRKIAEILNVKIFGLDRGKFKKSEYRRKNKEIVIYRDALEKMAAEITDPDLSKRILRLLIAHELFHHLENVKLGPIYKRFKFKGRFGLGYYIKGLSEVAAQAFTQKLLGIEFSPQVFDYLTYVMFTSDLRY